MQHNSFGNGIPSLYPSTVKSILDMCRVAGVVIVNIWYTHKCHHVWWHTESPPPIIPICNTPRVHIHSPNIHSFNFNFTLKTKLQLNFMYKYLSKEKISTNRYVPYSWTGCTADDSEGVSGNEYNVPIASDGRWRWMIVDDGTK